MERLEKTKPEEAGKPQPSIVDPVHAKNSLCSSLEQYTKASTIVPVILTHESKPEVEYIVYAMLDTQSDSSFILSKRLIC